MKLLPIKYFRSLDDWYQYKIQYYMMSDKIDMLELRLKRATDLNRRLYNIVMFSLSIFAAALIMLVSMLTG